MSQEKIKIISAYSKKNKVILKFKSQGRTKQQFSDECNINNIVNQNNKTGLITHLNPNAPQYGVANSVDFQDALNTIVEAENMFSALSSQTRRQFNNDPKEFLKFVETEGNEDELRRLGLLNPKTPPVEPPVASQPPSKPSSEVNPSSGVDKEE